MVLTLVLTSSNYIKNASIYYLRGFCLSPGSSYICTPHGACSLIRMTDQSNEVFKAYSVLGLPVNASQNDVKEKFKELALQVCIVLLLADVFLPNRVINKNNSLAIYALYHILYC